MAKCFGLLGTARSGTSVTTQILHHMGVVMGWELESEDGNPRFDWPDPTPMNPHGFFQDAPVENIQDAIWGDEYPLEGTRAPHDERLAEFQRLIRIRCERGHAKWGLKAHRVPWMMDEFLDACSDDVMFVVTRRNPALSAKSLDHWFPHYGIDRCEEWIRRAVAQIDFVLASPKYAHIPRFEVQFDRLFDDSFALLRELSEFVGSDADQAELLALIDPLLRRTVING